MIRKKKSPHPKRVEPEPDVILVDGELEPWTGSARDYNVTYSEEHARRKAIKFKLQRAVPAPEVPSPLPTETKHTARLRAVSEEILALKQKVQKVREAYNKEKRNADLLKRRLLDEERRYREIEIKLEEGQEHNRLIRERLEAEVRILESEREDFERRALSLEETLEEIKSQLEMEQVKRQALQRLLQEQTKEVIEARKKEEGDVQKRVTQAYKLQEGYWESQIEAYEKKTKMLEQDKKSTEYLLAKTKESLDEKKRLIEKERKRANALKHEIEALKKALEEKQQIEEENQTLKERLESLQATARGSALEIGSRLTGSNGEQYEVTADLKGGGMGQVYAAVRLGDNEKLVIKTMISSFGGGETKKVMRFVQEARIQMTFDHPNVVRGYDLLQTKDNCYLIMEFVSGVSVETMLEQQGRIPPLEASKIIFQIAMALEYLENLALIHRDIKPSNIIVTENGTAKLADFGIVKMTDTKCALTTTGIIMGTPYYVSPEQLTEDPLDIQSDVYSLGATFYHMVIGEVPFTGKDQIEVLTSRLRKMPKLDRAYIFSTDLQHKEELDSGKIGTALYQEFEKHKRILSPQVAVEFQKRNRHWLVRDQGRQQSYFIVKEGNTLNIYEKLDLPKEITSLIEKMIDKRPKKRPHPAELVQTLKDYLVKQGVDVNQLVKNNDESR